MHNLETIINNIEQYYTDIPTLVQQLKACDVPTFEGFKRIMRDAGEPIPQKYRKAIEAEFTRAEEEDWTVACQLDTVTAYKDYMAKYPQGKHVEDANKAIERLNHAKELNAAEEDWERLDKNDKDALEDFIIKYHDSPHTQEAKEYLERILRGEYGIEALKKEIESIEEANNILAPQKEIYRIIASFLDRGQISGKNLLDAIKEDHNFVSGDVVKLLKNSNYLNYSDLLKTGIEDDFIKAALDESPSNVFPIYDPFDSITQKDCTEVYFWGIPSSGKTCALGAILRSAAKGELATFTQDNRCQGYGYMTRLSEVFKMDSTSTLPPGTPTDAYFEMGFILREKKDKKEKEHPITCIDLAGELIEIMYKRNANEPITDLQENVLKTLTNVLVDKKTNNRKIHFFVIEYGAEKRQYLGLTQPALLDASMQYIRQLGIFEKNTDKIYLLITKVDKTGKTGKGLKIELVDYLKKYYNNFYSQLKDICRSYEINGGEVEVLPFSLGTVCFQQYCKYEDIFAANIVKLLLDNTYGYKPGKWNKWTDKLRR